LCAAEFIHEQPVTGDTEFVFKHALTQEVAYSLLLIERRKQLHERVGYSTETLFADKLGDHLDALAHHYSHSDNADKAIEYLGRAGKQAMERSAHVEAIAALTMAVELVPRLPKGFDRMKREIQLQLALGQASIPVKGWAAVEVERPFNRVLEISDRMGDSAESFPALFGLWTVYHVRGFYRDARRRAEELLRAAEVVKNPSFLVLAHLALGETLLHIGELALAHQHQEKTLSFYNPERDRPLVLALGTDAKMILSYEGWTLWFLGYPDQAIQRGREALAFAEELAHPNSIGAARFFDTIVRILRREPEIVLASAERVSTYSAEHGLANWLLFAPRYRAWALAHQGHHEEAIASMRQCDAICEAVGAHIGTTDRLRQLAEVLIAAARIDDAAATIAEALGWVERLNEHYVEAEIYHLSGLLSLKRDKSGADDASACFERAIEIAQSQSAKSWELRATTSLARLLASQGRRDEARAMLANIYNWFTEGFDTADLKDAKALLAELSNSP
jgi:predicted ATPase